MCKRGILCRDHNIFCPKFSYHLFSLTQTIVSCQIKKSNILFFRCFHSVLYHFIFNIASSQRLAIKLSAPGVCPDNCCRLHNIHNTPSFRMHFCKVRFLSLFLDNRIFFNICQYEISRNFLTFLPLRIRNERAPRKTEGH